MKYSVQSALPLNVFFPSTSHTGNRNKAGFIITEGA